MHAIKRNRAGFGTHSDTHMARTASQSANVAEYVWKIGYSEFNLNCVAPRGLLRHTFSCRIPHGLYLHEHAWRLTPGEFFVHFFFFFRKEKNKISFVIRARGICWTQDYICDKFYAHIFYPLRMCVGAEMEPMATKWGDKASSAEKRELFTCRHRHMRF